MSAPDVPEPSPPPPWAPLNGPRKRHNWLPLAILTAALLLAGAMVAAAIILSHGTSDNTPAPSTPASQSSSAAASTDAASATCSAWRTTKPALDAIPALPSGWDWNTPDIDKYIKNRNAAISRALDLFEPKIADDPTDVAAIAHEYVSARRVELQQLSDRTYTQADGVAGNRALAALNELCGIS
jgi:hypothetical protein